MTYATTRLAPLAGRRNPLLDADLLLDKGDPLTTARKFLGTFYLHGGNKSLVYSDDTFYAWNGVAYSAVELGRLRAELYPWLETHNREVRRGDTVVVMPFQPTKRDIELTTDAVKALAYTPLRPPAWLSPDTTIDPAELMVAPNGIFDPTGGTCRRLSPPTSSLFTINALDYPVEPKAPRPAKFAEFLTLVFGGDEQSVALLQEWFGYVLTADTRQQKILMLVGPRRSGKGTIARILARLIGMANVCAPTLAGLATNFGLWPLIDKRLAIISDARLSGRTDQAIVTERLLSISGEDAITIDRKNMTPLTVKLPTRFMICTNELPRLNDASGALAGRLLVLHLPTSFYGKEDTELCDRLAAEVPGILMWAVAGLRRLRERGRFVQPDKGQAMIDELHDLASPVSAFVRDWCRVEPDAKVPVQELFDAWCVWCKEQGEDRPGPVHVFGRDLRAAVNVSTRQVRDEDESRVRQFAGITLTAAARETAAKARAAADRKHGQG